MLSFVPCIDKDECNINSDTKTEILTSNNNDKHQTENGVCTPFCICSHCSASAFSQSIKTFSIHKNIFQSGKYPVFNNSFSSQISFAIWQPPKLS